jgi:large subunit ribosomal protein L15
MTIKLHDLKPAKGATRPRKRVGRGIAGKGGKTAGRGTKGQRARDTVPASFEGGQMPLHMRVPKLKGFNNPFRVEYQAINLDVLDAVAETHGLAEVTPAALHDHGLVRKGALVKVLGRGELRRAVRVEAHAFSAAAEAAITAAGGTVERVPLPFGAGRPPARGNQFTNR